MHADSRDHRGREVPCLRESAGVHPSLFQKPAGRASWRAGSRSGGQRLVGSSLALPNPGSWRASCSFWTCSVAMNLKAPVNRRTLPQARDCARNGWAGVIPKSRACGRVRGFTPAFRPRFTERVALTPLPYQSGVRRRVLHSSCGWPSLTRAPRSVERASGANPRPGSHRSVLHWPGSVRVPRTSRPPRGPRSGGRSDS